MSQPDTSAAPALTAEAAELLFRNGQTTLHTAIATERLAAALHWPARIVLTWETIAVWPQAGAAATIPARPTDINMGKVTETLGAIDRFCGNAITAAQLRTRLDAIAQSPPISLLRFAAMAAAGAAALAVIFGAMNPAALALIALGGGAGAGLRRALSHLTHNSFVQPFCAALLAGAIGAVAVRLHLGASQYLVAECPCMILVPGPHLLNGALDLARARMTLGIARLSFAFAIIAAISAGLLLGLSLGGATLPVGGTPPPAPLIYDVIAAGVAVAAYGTFFSMPWRALYVPTALGMLAHALRWVAVVRLGAHAEVGALVACLFVGCVAAPVSDRMHLPFAGLAFASVVSLIPGVFLFRMAGGLTELVALGARTPLDLLTATIADGGTAFLILMAMAFGLLVPRMIFERFG